MTASHSSSVMLTRTRSRRMPALLTRMSRSPKCSTAELIRRCAPSQSATLSPLTIASPPMASISATTCCAGVMSVPVPSLAPPRSFTTTFAPSAAKNSACSRPIPRPAPVMIATRPSSELMTPNDNQATVLRAKRERDGASGVREVERRAAVELLAEVHRLAVGGDERDRPIRRVAGDRADDEAGGLERRHNLVVGEPGEGRDGDDIRSLRHGDDDRVASRRLRTGGDRLIGDDAGRILVVEDVVRIALENELQRFDRSLCGRGVEADQLRYFPRCRALGHDDRH